MILTLNIFLPTSKGPLKIAAYLRPCQKSMMEVLEAITGGEKKEKVFLKISRNSQENKCARVSFLTKSQTWDSDSGTGVLLWILRNF